MGQEIIADQKNNMNFLPPSQITQGRFGFVVWG
jgi:hypothetical protein